MTFQDKLQLTVQNDIAYLINAEYGNIDGVSIVDKFGTNSDIDSGALPEDIWSGGGVFDGLDVSGAETLSIVSSSANDMSEGAGMQQVFLEGLDSDFNVISETIALNGTTPVITQNAYIRINRAYGILSGSSQVNEGNITFSQSSSSTVMNYIEANEGQTQYAIYTVPSDHVAFAISYGCSLLRSASAYATIEFQSRVFGSNTWRVVEPLGVTQNDRYQREGYITKQFSGKTDIRMRCISASTNNIQVNASFDLILIREDKL